MLTRNWAWPCILVMSLATLACEDSERGDGDSDNDLCSEGEIEDCTCTTGTAGTRTCDPATGEMERCVCFEATMRFCHNIRIDDEDTVFTVRVGSGNEEVVFESADGACDPQNNSPCRSIVSGTDVPISIEHKSSGFFIEGNRHINKGGEYIGFAYWLSVVDDPNDPNAEPYLVTDLSVDSIPDDKSCDSYDWWGDTDYDIRRY